MIPTLRGFLGECSWDISWHAIRKGLFTNLREHWIILIFSEFISIWYWSAKIDRFSGSNRVTVTCLFKGIDWMTVEGEILLTVLLTVHTLVYLLYHVGSYLSSLLFKVVTVSSIPRLQVSDDFNPSKNFAPVTRPSQRDAGWRCKLQCCVHVSTSQCHLCYVGRTVLALRTWVNEHRAHFYKMI